jgi:hypothetical protein
MDNVFVFMFVNSGSGEQIKLEILAESEEIASAKLTHYLQEHEQLPPRELWDLQQIFHHTSSHLFKG